MGCSYGVNIGRISEEEKLVSAAERFLELQDIDPSTYDKEINSQALDNYLSDLQLKHAYKSLGINYSFLKDKKSLLYKFYKSLKVGVVGYKAISLVCLGTWLSNINTKKKAEILYENFNRGCNSSFDPLDQENMIDEMIEVTEAIIKFAQFLYPDSNQQLDNYLKQIISGKDLLRQYLVLLICQNEEDEKFTKKQFICAFRDKTIKKLCSSNGFRELLIECSIVQKDINRVQQPILL
ncbi:unnamed protein product [Blepharisma stoltei]|uniref:Uncharacterized protein n=1 Tax=Blepharisma stoltei TaxID=1481888 RepID=A0AAU9KB83_9CILI|nr:unnamed protein product [Blepharisma stoltei]